MEQLIQNIILVLAYIFCIPMLFMAKNQTDSFGQRYKRAFILTHRLTLWGSYLAIVIACIFSVFNHWG